MIRIEVESGFEDISEISEIYNSIVEEILNCIKDKVSIRFTYNSEVKTIKYTSRSKECKRTIFAKIIKDFLVSKEFYNYKLDIQWIDSRGKKKLNQDILKALNDLTLLNGNCKLDSFMSNSIRNKGPANQFYKDYIESKTPKELFKKLEIVKQTQGNITLAVLNVENFITNNFSGYKDILDLYTKIFSYDKLTDINRHKIITKMKVNVCPYCNMNYTLTYKMGKGANKTTADLDHFYIKSKHPQYAICLYNFIPSCPVCNSRLKSITNTTIYSHIYPHKEEFGDKAKFKICNIIGMELTEDKTDLDIKLVTQKNVDDRILNSMETFKIEELYKNHIDIGKELLDKSKKYNETWIKEKADIFDGEASARVVIFGKKLDSREIARTSLGKFRMDLLQQLKVYK